VRTSNASSVGELSTLVSQRSKKGLVDTIANLTIETDSNCFAVLPRIFYSEEFTFFGHKPGGTWHGGDVAVVLWFVEHPWALASLAAAFIGTLAGIVKVRLRRATRWGGKSNSEFA